MSRKIETDTPALECIEFIEKVLRAALALMSEDQKHALAVQFDQMPSPRVPVYDA